MRKEVQQWHNDVVAYHTHQVYGELLHKHHLTTETVRYFDFEDERGLMLEKPLRGYLAEKGDDVKKKYFIEEVFYNKLPLRIESTQELLYKESSKSKSVILQPLKVKPFKITPERKWATFRQFVDEFIPFQHTAPLYWTLHKIIAIMAYVGKVFICERSVSEFGKSSAYALIHALTQKSPVFQPRSVPGVLAKVTGDGNMVFDEVHECSSDVKQVMENFSLQVAGNTPVYHNGALQARNTRSQYDVSQQSITYLYNDYQNYATPEKHFWDNIWKNKKALQSRFLKIRMQGQLIESFDIDFSIPRIAQENEQLYINCAKQLLYLKERKMNDLYAVRWESPQTDLKGRHAIIFKELLWGIDLYCRSQKEFDTLTQLFLKAIKDESDIHEQSTLDIQEEWV